MTRVLVIGRYPPPIGGVTVHIQRLAAQLAQNAYDVSVVDLYSGRVAKPSALGPGQQGSRLEDVQTPGVWKSIRYLRQMVSDAVVHFHVSDGGKFYGMAPLLLHCSRGAAKRVVTLHSGNWVERFRRLPLLQRYVAIWALRCFDDIICVNEQQQQELLEVVSSRIHVIPAYLPASLERLEPLPEEVEHLRERVDVVVVTSGYGQSLYDYQTVMEGVEQAQVRLGLRLGLVVATYSSWNPDYWQEVVRRMLTSLVPVVDVRNLSPSQFLRLLSEADMYVRATRSDGDAVAIREAASVCTQVIASDSVPRPSGTAVFRTGDAESLATRIVEAVTNSTTGRLPLEASTNYYSEIHRVYHS